MADTKISGLPASTVPLAGTEVLPIVQSSTTKQVSIANVTAGRDVSALSVATTKDTTPSSSLGAFSYGTLTYADVNHLATFQTSVANYAQIEIQNTSTDPAASSDMVVGNSLTTASTYYGDFGMNSSGWAGSAPFNTANNVYLTATSASLALGTTTSNTLLFATNSTLAATISTAQVLSTVNDATINGVTVGKGGGAVASNTVVGNGAMAATNTGGYNAAFGTGALAAATSASGAVAIGRIALNAATSGTGLVAIGGNAAYKTTTGANITAVGSSVLTNNLTGGGICAVGNLAVFNNTLSSNLTASGAQSLYNNSTAVTALSAITSGGTGYNGGGTGGPFTVTLSTTSGATFNTYPTASIIVTAGVITTCTLVSAGFGASVSTATVLTVSSAAMVAAGFSAGGSGLAITPTLTSGNNNTAYGYFSGFANSVNANITGSNNTYYGYSTVGSGTNNTNEMVIGYSAIGLGSNTTMIGNASTTATYNGNNSATWAIISDISVKKNIVSLVSCMDIISALRPVEFDYIENDKHDVGFIAQEYQKVLPTQIIEQDSGLLGLNQNLTPYLVKALQELNAKLDAYVASHP